MNFKTQICTTLKQSERLLALGLKKETADCNVMLTIRGERYHTGFNMLRYRDYCFRYGRDHNYQPAWSLHRLIEIAGIHYLELWWHLGIYEQVISLIEERIEEGLISTKYLEI